ncbi:hypothetical protein ACIBTZ_31880 [Micromonospora sp. NPDC049460]|uniref:hypothetical protein n=1 Tax=Micromonospora sp. NPDC049460 TaxID=3364272 RepID=UPI00379765F1
MSVQWIIVADRDAFAFFIAVCGCLAARTSGMHDAVMPGQVETAIRARVGAGTRLPTPTGRATFGVGEVSPAGLVLLFGTKQTRTVFSWSCLEGIPGYLHGRGWVRVGANRDVHGSQSTLDGYLKTFVKRQAADYVAVVLERAGVVDLDRERPARVRLRRT